MKNEVNRALVAKKDNFQSKSVPRGTRTIWRYLSALFILFTFAVGNVWGALTAHTPGTYEKAIDKGGYGATIVTVAERDYEVYGFSYYSSGTKPQILWAGTSTNNASAESVLCSNLSTTVQEIAGWISMSTEGKSSTYSMPSGSEFAASSVGTSGLYQMKMQGHSLTLKVKGYDQFSFLGNDNNGDKSKNKYMTVFINGTDVTKDVNSSTTIRRYDLTASTEYTIVITGLGSSNEHIDAFSLRLPEATSHTVTYKSGDGSGDDVVDDDATVVGGCPSTFSYTGYDFAGWKDSDNNDVEVGDAVTSDMTLTAQWTVHVAKYTVKYMDGTTLLGTEEVNVTEHPAGLAENPKKDCYTFAGWDPALSGVSGSDGDVVEVNATWTPKYASTLDFAAVTTAGTTGSNPIGTFLASGNMVASNLGGDSGWETSTAKSGFIGYKLKNTSAVIKFLVKAGKEVEITLGSVGAAAKLNKGGVESEIAKKSGDNEQTVIPAFVAESDMLVTITTNASDKSTVTLKKISIVDPAPKYTVTYALNGGTGTTPTEVDHKEGEKFNLHDGATGITAPTNKTFVNWKDQDDALFAGGAEYTMPGKNVTLTAQWAGDVYTVKFMDGETVLDTKVVEVGSHPTDIEHPTKPLYTFAAWQLSGSDVNLDEVSGTKDAIVTLTARWAVAYASNVNFKEAATQALGVETALNTYHYASDASDISFEEKGLKIKTNAARFYFNVAPGKVAEIKFGNISGATYSVDGGAAETLTSSQLKATYSASAQSCVMTMTTAAYNIVEKVTIHDPYQVLFDDNGADNPVAPQYAYPSVTLPSATKGTESFLGWFDDATAGNKIGDAGASYTPTADITLYAHWEAISTDNTLSDLKVGGVTVEGFSPAVHTYYVVLPYGTKPENIPAISATANSAKAKQVAIQQAVWTDAPYDCYRAQANVQAEDESWGYYDVRFSFAPKDGVSIIKVATTGGTNKTVTGLYAGDGDVNLSSSKKMDGGKYIGFTLDGTTLQAGDRINVHTTTASTSGGSHIIFYDNMTDKNELYDTEEIGGVGNNIFTINAAMVGNATAYVYRSDADAVHKWNGYIDYIEVTRAMNPVLTAITIDERDGEMDALNDHHFNVTIPYEADLAALTVVPTIVRNAAHATTPEAVISNEGAWIIGDNTYRIMDKDGDYTDYTITLDRDVLKHTVSFNTHGGSAVASVEVVHNEYLTAVPDDPSKEDYIFKHWSLTDGGEEVDITTVQITENKEFHAVWASDGAIKLLDGATVNHTNYITGVTADETVEFMGNTVNYAKFSGTVSGVNGVKDLTRVIAYNATTNKTKIRIYAHNNSTSGRNIYVKGLVEGASAAVDLANIALGNKEDKISDWIEFNNAANRTIYIFVPSSAGDVYFTQVKVIESGETPMKMAGEAGYSLNFNKGRFFGLKDLTAHFEGMDVAVASSDCAPLNTEVVKLASTSISFTVAAPVTLTVTTNNNKTYYVTKGAAGTENETAKTGASDFDLTAGTWYITGGASNVEIKSIAFAAPKCAEPVIDNDPESNTNFGPGNLTASVTAHATDGATLAYQWYDASDDSEVSGATDATLTTTTEGTYYVIITASKAGYDDRSVQSANATLGYRDITIATLSALSYGGTAIALEADKYEYRVDLPEGTTDVPALAATATQAAYGATAVPTDATEFVNYEAISTVLVTAEDGVTQLTYTVHFYVDHIYTALVDVTGTTTWNWTGSDDVTINDVANRGLILANYIDGLEFEKIEGKEGERARRNQNGGCYQGTQLHFNTTVYGKVKIYFRAPSSGDNCTIYVNNNGKRMNVGNRGNSFGWSKEVVVKGDVVIEMVKDGGGDTRVQQIVFTKLTPDYEREVSNNIGTLCVDHNVMVGGAMGATFYQIASRNADYDYKIDFEEVLPTEELKAGEPYIFQSTTGKIELFFGETEASEPVAVRGMIGNYGESQLAITADNMSTIYYFAQNKLWTCENLVGSYLKLNEHRAYIDLSQVPTYAEYEASKQQQNNAPRRRISLVMNGQQVATGIENGGLINGENGVQKVLINGKLFILRGEKMYDVTGKLVK